MSETAKTVRFESDGLPFLKEREIFSCERERETERDSEEAQEL